jgi:hypothetical protein
MYLDRWVEWRDAFPDAYFVLKKGAEKVDAMVGG